MSTNPLRCVLLVTTTQIDVPRPPPRLTVYISHSYIWDGWCCIPRCDERIVCSAPFPSPRTFVVVTQKVK